ncbi:MAG: hypothetical protein M3Z16_11155 [Pseudomonadota bacterium]|nr:hypothetical protein [Pseudomonadota bacterium]
MKFIVASLRWIGWPLRRRAASRRDDDFADMGTALGLDASTTLDAESLEGVAAQAGRERPNRLQLRLHRRSSF